MNSKLNNYNFYTNVGGGFIGENGNPYLIAQNKRTKKLSVFYYTENKFREYYPYQDLEQFRKFVELKLWVKVKLEKNTGYRIVR